MQNDMIPSGAAAKQFGVDTRTLTSWLKSGQLPGGLCLPSGRWRISQAAVDAALAAGRD